MPLYEYRCTDCGRDCELLIRGQEQPECPSCHGTKLDKLFSVVAAHTGGKGPDLAPFEGCGKPQCGMGGCQGGF